jgi:DNA-directed RNA polymerase specialized sigma subunit
VFCLIVTAEDNNMLSINNNCDHAERERQVIELYHQGKSTRDIAKELRMSLRDISVILRENHVSHGIVITDNGNSDNNNSENTNNKSLNQKATRLTNYFLKTKSHLK